MNYKENGVRLQFLGATRQVTGSRYYLEADGARLLVDCGMFQERHFQYRNWEKSPIDPRTLDAVLLTHAHLDHCGLLPKLVREGFRGKIFATSATAELAEIILRDSAEIQMEDVAYKLKRHRREGRTGKYPVVPLYTPEDVERTIPRFEPVGYAHSVRVNGHATVEFHDAGHILGSAILDVSVKRDGQPQTVIFSGDLGQWDRPLLRDPTTFDRADYIVMESTYGDREHLVPEDVATQLAKIINETIEAGGNVVIPTFAVERAQELMYYISQLVSEKRIPQVPIYLDSPMASNVTTVFTRHHGDLDEATHERIKAGDWPLRFPGLSMTDTVDASKGINQAGGSAIIMATSGMCTAGRIKFHLRKNIGRPESTILFVGFQVKGTLGRQILDRSPEVRIHGLNHLVRARVAQIQGFSGHADRAGLLRWLSTFRQPPTQLFLTHGEESVSLKLAEQITSHMQWPVVVPQYQQTVELK
jgi:metallo-beta-lactamase family protein